MIAELVDKLMDRMIQLVQHQKERKRSLLNDFITPAFELFEKIHEDYVSAFIKFRAEAQEEGFDLDNLIEEIQSHYLYSESQRAKLRDIASVHVNRFPEFSAFYKEMYAYLTKVNDPVSSYDLDSDEEPPFFVKRAEGVGQLFLTGAIEELSTLRGKTEYTDYDPFVHGFDIADDDPRKRNYPVNIKATEIFDSLLGKLISKYGAVCREYAKLQVDLADP